VTDLDERIHEELERLVSTAPLPPSVAEITDRRPTVDRDRRPLLLGLAAAAVVLAFVAGAMVLRHQPDDAGGTAAPTAAEPDLVVYLRPGIMPLQQEAIEEQLRNDALVVAVDFFDQQDAYDEFRALYANDPALIESVMPEVLPPSFRVDVVDHDMASAQTVAEVIRAFPGVQRVDFGLPQALPELPDDSNSLLGPDGTCGRLYLPIDTDGDGVADDCIRARDMPGSNTVVTGTSVPLDGATCPRGFDLTDLDGDGAADTCVRDGYQGPGGG
jgi:hypothetical protein